MRRIRCGLLSTVEILNADLERLKKLEILRSDFQFSVVGNLLSYGHAEPSTDFLLNPIVASRANTTS